MLCNAVTGVKRQIVVVAAITVGLWLARPAPEVIGAASIDLPDRVETTVSVKWPESDSRTELEQLFPDVGPKRTPRFQIEGGFFCALPRSLLFDSTDEALARPAVIPTTGT